MKERNSAIRWGAVDGSLLSAQSTDESEANAHLASLAGLAQLAGFEYFLLAAFPRGDKTGFSGNCLASNWPQELLDFYSGYDVFHHSKLVASLKNTILPVFSDGVPFGSAAANQESARLNSAFHGRGLSSTVAFTLHDADLQQYIFAFSGRGLAPSRKQSADLLYKSAEVLENLVFEKGKDLGPAERLTRREIECLRWSAAGKSSEEIAIILELSTHTVAGYLKSAMRKLDSVNRMQAVARAYRYRLL